MDNVLENDKCTNCKDKLLFEKVKICYNSSEKSLIDEHKYASVIITLAYGLLITLFFQLSEKMNSKSISLFIICLLISVGLFIINELFKMISSYIISSKINELWLKIIVSEITLEQWEIERLKCSNSLYKPYLKVYPWILSFSIVAGVLSWLVLSESAFKIFLS
jgi:hypothetical protein